MRVAISSAVLDAIIAEADLDHGREVCGLLFGAQETVLEHTSCANVAADPSCAFEIDPKALIDAHKSARQGGPAIVGCYHSHPEGPPVPSARDAAAAPPDGSLWLIVAARGVGLWRAVDHGPLHGRFDAVELVRDGRACVTS
jgi:proteasome lid subunit RPN8/RPN11